MNKSLRQHLEMLKACGINELYIKTRTKAIQTIETPRSLSFATKADGLFALMNEYSTCQKCELWHGRKKFVYGEGSPDAKCMVIGEGPGEQENIQGRPFVGPAGQLLDKMLIAIKIERKDVYIANIVKCRPPGNRNPQQDEREACLPYLLEQIEIIKPKIFLFLGLVAAQTLLETNLPMHVLREKPYIYLGRPAFVTYHPSALLRNADLKRPAWEDLQRFQKVYDEL